MSKKVTIILSCIIIIISLCISIYIPNRKKIEDTEDTSINYSVIDENGKKGISKNGNIIIEPQYENIIIPNPHRAVFLCENGENQKFVNEKNNEIFTQYENVEVIEISNGEYEKNILIYQDKEKLGLLGITGNVITFAKYDEIFSLGFKGGEVVVRENEKFGILDEKGKTKIKIKYDSIQSDEYYTEEYKYQKSGYIVKITTEDGYRYGYYDSEGIQVLTEEYNQITRLTQIQSEESYLIVAKNGQYGIFVNNNKIINTQYQNIEYNSDLEIFIVERTGKYGAISLKGKEILKAEYNELKVNGLYIYTLKDEEKKVWDTNGLEVDINYETIIQKTDSKEYFIKNEGGYYSILNNNMEEISKGKYKYLEFIYDNYFIATNETDKSGIIDSQENLIIEYKYDIIQKVKGTLVIQAVEFNTDKTIFYDKEFNLIKEITNANIEYLENGFKVYNDEQEIILDTNGKIIDK